MILGLSNRASFHAITSKEWNVDKKISRKSHTLPIGYSDMKVERHRVWKAKEYPNRERAIIPDIQYTL